MKKENLKTRSMPYFKFYPDDWLTGKIQFCNLETQGFFLNLCALLWRENGKIKKDKFLVRKLRCVEPVFNQCLTDLKDSEIVFEKDGFLSVKFIDDQLNLCSKYLQKCSEAGQKSAEKRRQKATNKSICNKSIHNKSKEGDREFDQKTKTNIIQAAEQIRKVHPKVRQPIATDMEIVKAINREFDKGHPIEEAIDYVRGKTELYKLAVDNWSPQEKKYIVGSFTWFQNGGYLEDPASWGMGNEEFERPTVARPEVVL